MENNFYIGIVNHKKRINRGYFCEKLVLYSEDNIYYTDLINGITYTLDAYHKNYVVKESIIKTDISEHQTDYLYLLQKHKNNLNIKKRKFNLFKFN